MDKITIYVDAKEKVKEIGKESYRERQKDGYKERSSEWDKTEKERERTEKNLCSDSFLIRIL